MALLLALTAPFAADAVSPAYPELRVLSRDDPLYLQQQSALEEFRRIAESRNRGGTPFPPLVIFEYAKRTSEDLFSVNARLGLRYDTLATLNDTAAKGEFDAKTRILVPSQDGVFVNDPPRGWLEQLMLSTRLANGMEPERMVVIRDGKRQPVWFFANDTFSGIERKYYLGILLRFPLDVQHVSSAFGWRSDPFTGRQEFHEGLDLSAPAGASVRAARDGVVTETGNDATLGNYIVLTHTGGLQTVYGHLSAIGVIMEQKVIAGAIIGAVGSTGYATGPHLHFEVREKGTPVDPAHLLAMKKD
jgi:murein DD-endopeptidase MepM/ murein hydrolase activator NlpD